MIRGRCFCPEHAFARGIHRNPRTHRRGGDIARAYRDRRLFTGCALTKARCGTAITAPCTFRLT